MRRHESVSVRNHKKSLVNRPHNVLRFNVSRTGMGLALVAGFAVYYVLDAVLGLRLSEEDETIGSDFAIHSIEAYPEEAVSAGGR